MFLTGTRTVIHKAAKMKSEDLIRGATISSQTADSKEGRRSKEVLTRLLRTIGQKLGVKTGHKGNILHSRIGKKDNFGVLKTGEPNHKTMEMGEGVVDLSVITGKRYYFFQITKDPSGSFLFDGYLDGGCRVSTKEAEITENYGLHIYKLGFLKIGNLFAV